MAEGRTLVAGRAEGVILVLSEPLSFWGGMDAATGRVIDGRHPQAGATLTGRVVAMPAGRGSSSAPSVLAEALRTGTGPAAILLREPDALVALGAMVADELYGIECPVVVLSAPDHEALRDGVTVRVRAGPERASVELI